MTTLLQGLWTVVAGRDRGPAGRRLLTALSIAAGVGAAMLAYDAVGELEPAVRPALAAAVAMPFLLLPRRPLMAWRIAMVGTLVNLPAGVAPDGLSWPWHPLQVVILPALVLLVAVVHRVATVFWVVLLTTATTAGHLAPSRTPVVVGAIVVLAVVGDQVRRRVEAQRGLVAERKLTEAEQERSAVLEERARIAREMHDVVAHHMSMIAVRAETAPYRLSDDRDTWQCEFGEIAGASRAALQDMRRLLGVLRSDAVDVVAAPAPGLADIAGMVGAARESGLDVVLEPVAAAHVPPLVSQAAYRIVQEGLSNATRHAAGASVRVAVTIVGDSLRIRVHNAAAGRSAAARPGGGHGLRGMRERVGALGGDLTAGPASDGGYEVRAALPLRDRQGDDGHMASESSSSGVLVNTRDGIRVVDGGHCRGQRCPARLPGVR